MAQPTVAVIGLGAMGLVTLKNLLEVSLDAVGFERNSYIGGLWKYTDSPTTSVLKTTRINVSKERGCFNDYPFRKGTGSYPTAEEVQAYLESYTEEFDLLRHCRLGVTVERVTQDESHNKWVIQLNEGDQTREQKFDKVVVCNGSNATPIVPSLSGQALFEGRILHSVAFKQPEDFKSQRVLLVGLGNTAADVAASLVGVADEIWLSHRTGSYVLPRILPDGTALDHNSTYRKLAISQVLERYTPSVADWAMDKFIRSVQSKAWTIKPEWRLSPAPLFVHKLFVVSDDLVENLDSGNIKSVAGFKQIIGSYTVELESGQTVEVDTIILCTGYNLDYSILGQYDPTRHQSAFNDPTPEIPILYRNLFSLDYPESLACMGAVIFAAPAFEIFDLAAMAIAQLWKLDSNSTTSRLPDKSEMLRQVEDHLSYARSISARGAFNPRWVKGYEWLAWIQDVIGTRVDEHLSSFSWKAWSFWWHDRSLARLMVDGISSPHFYRLFDTPGGRKAWPGARGAIIQVNEDVKRGLEGRKSGALNGSG